MALIHITNGDCAAELIEAAFNTQKVIPWRDILYEGPVQSNLDGSQFSHQRSEYLASQGYESYETIYSSFQDLQTQLTHLPNFEEVILWFEHDTYDQLQLVQILSYLYQKKLNTRLSLICINHYPGIDPFLGLGQLDEQQIKALFPCRQKVTDIQLKLAHQIWLAFTASEPSELLRLTKGDLTALPFLKNALLRYFREFPSNHNGLTWTEQYILDSTIAGTNNIVELFRQLPITEDEYFLGMGDVTFKQIVTSLAEAENPLIRIKERIDEIEDSELELTKLGERVAQGEEDWIKINGIDEWRGGVHLTLENVWRYSLATHEIIGPFNLNILEDNAVGEK
ncbi:DUF1835 domain-containing protein [Legionella hackeliae]|uniref:RNA polymerase, sigma-24 subunit, ECF subfamily n=1 Tax=Legionella hackeliae TaxID=449 RepID=A0A0A8UTT7_LEGHA|nr:DUF1835 domain-containing protein [Legionella hackeliae]KTD13811.1 hypothetical protein Lhac_0655 [Legionella hackeliae]CEK10512.1 RNA polymerase, sigma-24 subunit, ECF subfamily [Legionella hackeliae]STX47249.1 Domain of uncharacterised function (DUF1835) [Legionella hackeliae]